MLHCLVTSLYQCYDKENEVNFLIKEIQDDRVVIVTIPNMDREFTLTDVEIQEELLNKGVINFNMYLNYKLTLV